jgi:hypothetical protein
MHIRVKFDDDRFNGSQVTVSNVEFKMAAAAILILIFSHL